MMEKKWNEFEGFVENLLYFRCTGHSNVDAQFRVRIFENGFQIFHLVLNIILILQCESLQIAKF